MGRESFNGVSDEELIQRAREGEDPAKEALFKRYLTKLNHWAHQRTPHPQADRPSASDLGQVSAAHAYAKFSTFEKDTGKAFLAWLKTIYLRKTSSSRLHAQRQMRQVPVGLVSIEEHGEPPNPSWVKSASQLLALKDEWRMLRPHLNLLPTEQQEIIQFRMDGYSFAEIAQRMNKSNTFVSNRYQRGIDILKRRVRSGSVHSSAGQQTSRLRAGTRIGEHVIIGYADSGAMSDVYQGKHSTSGRLVAVKVLSSLWREDPELTARFVNEAQALQHLRHPRLVTLFAQGILRSGLPYMILEWLPANLHQELERLQGPLASHLASQVIAQLADVLASMHQKGFVHRDLKPANILVCPRSSSHLVVKLTDLGLAKRLSDEQAARPTTGPRPFVSTVSGTSLGTWEYMAPEQWTDAKTIDPKADVYSLGILFFQLLVGRLPFIAQQAQDWAPLHGKAAVPLDLLPHSVPGPVRQLLTRMLEKRSSERPTMHQVLAQLGPAEANSPE